MIPSIKHYLKQHQRLRQWLWFVALWLAGLGAVFLLALPIKILIRLAS